MSFTDTLVIAVIVLQVLDGWTTYEAIRTRNGREANPIVRKVIERMGLYPGLLLVKGVVIVGMVVARQYGVWEADGATFVLALLVALYVFVVTKNWRIMKS